jgi:electron-transferring-flavoprotein dehydrogenase
VEKPLYRVIHTVAGWPLKISARYHQIGGSWIYPMKDEKTGEDLVSIGWVLDLDYADATSSAHDFLQQFKTHPMVREILEGGERIAWGAKAIPASGYWGIPKLSAPGAVLVGDAAGMMNLAALKGVHYAIKSGILAAEAIYEGLKTGGNDFSTYEQAVEDSMIGKELYEQRNTRQPFQKGLIRGGPLVNLMIATKGRFPGGRWKIERNDAQPMFVGDSKDDYPQPDGKHTFDKLSSVFITGNATRDDAPNHIRVQKRVPREIAETWKWMCPAGVYEIPDDAPETGDVDVIVNYTNCIQCGAITAKGGRLTTPEGGDGPLYQNT